MHQAQGMTSEKGIGVMHSSERNLSSQRLTHVMATRVRSEISIITNDRDKLLGTIARNSGNKHSALETTGDRKIETDPTPSLALIERKIQAWAAAEKAAASPATDRDAAAVQNRLGGKAPDHPGESSIPQRPAPEKTLDRGI